MTITAKGVTRPGAPLPRQLNYESDLLFHLRAADLLLGWDPTEDVARAITSEDPTFARTTAGGYTRDALGFLQPWGKGVPRLHMYDLDGDGYWETPGLMLEGQRENGYTKSIELDDGAWTKIRSSCGGAAIDAIEAPDGTATADKLVEDGTGADSHFFTRVTPALSNDTQQSFGLFAKAAERSEIELVVFGKDAGVRSVWFDLDAGTIGTETNAVGLIEKYADGWYRCMIMADSSNGGSTPAIQVFLGEGSENATYDGDGASGVYIWGIQFEVDAAFPSSFILTAAAAVTRNADSLSYTLATLGLTMDDLTDDFTAYARMARPFHADASGSFGISPGVLRVSSAPSRLKGLQFVENARNMAAVVDTAGSDSTAVKAIPSGAVIEASAQFKNLRIGGQAAIDVGSGLGSFASAATAFSAWGDTTLNVGDIGGNDILFGAVFELKVGRGLRTMKQMQEAF